MKNTAIQTILSDIETTYTNIKQDYNREEIIGLLIEKHSLVHGWVHAFIGWFGQVHNGGHQQYVENGFHTSHNGSGNSDAHTALVKATEQVGGEIDFPELDEVLSILKDFKLDYHSDSEDELCPICNGSGCIDEDEDHEEFAEYGECGGSGYISVDRSDELTDTCKSDLIKLDVRFHHIASTLYSSVEDALETWLSKQG